ncbi:MAG: hypothetical protein HUJ26_18355 [Planctomycetaceae bacterium]|nr:hypothetical protein [Planctomycetaceae bacterium]
MTSYGLYYLIEDILIGEREPVIVSKNSENRAGDQSQTEDSNPSEQSGEGENVGQIAESGNLPTGIIDDPNVDGFAVAPFDDEQATAYQKDWAGRLGIPVESTNSIGMKFVLIPPGEFLMGSEEFDDEEKPPHPARLTTAYELGMFEVCLFYKSDAAAERPSVTIGGRRNLTKKHQ